MPVDIDTCQRVAGEEMKRLGYLPEPVFLSAWNRWVSMGFFIVKGIMALMVNFSRTKNLRDTLRRRLGRGA